MKITTEELALLVERLLRKRAEKERKRRWREVMDSDQFIKDVHESDTGISSKSFEIISERQTESGDTIIEFKIFNGSKRSLLSILHINSRLRGNFY